jgi:hypothetical protein
MPPRGWSWVELGNQLERCDTSAEVYPLVLSFNGRFGSLALNHTVPTCFVLKLCIHFNKFILCLLQVSLSSLQIPSLMVKYILRMLFL